MNLVGEVENFMALVADERIEIYNEFSLQHELGIYLRTSLSPLKVQFERNVSFFGLEKTRFEKREIDISVFSNVPAQNVAAIELKYPRSGQFPEQMFSFCKDIVFLEQLAKSGFDKCLFVAVADQRPFFEGASNGIYSYFRGGKTLHGTILKPTGKKDQEFYIQGSYDIAWKPTPSGSRFMTIDITAT